MMIATALLTQAKIAVVHVVVLQHMIVVVTTTLATVMATVTVVPNL